MGPFASELSEKNRHGSPIQPGGSDGRALLGERRRARKGLSRPMTYETHGRMRILPLFAWRSDARQEFEVKDARSAPPSAAAFQAVLEFEFLSRIIASKQSMDGWR